MGNLSRRDFLRLSATVATGAVLASCKPAAPAPAAPAKPAEKVEEKPKEEKPAAPAEKVTVRFMSRAGADHLPNYEKCLKEDFEPQYPGITVSLEPAPDGWIDKLLTEMIAGTAVDLFQAWGNIFYNWTERGLLLDVQPYVDATMSAEEIADYNEFQWTGLVMRGIRVGMPKYINIMTVTINKDIFDEFGVEYPPENGDWTHDDYEEMAKSLTKDRTGDGQIDLWGCWLPAWSWDRFWNHVYMFGGYVVDEPHGTRCTLGDPSDQAGLEWMYDMIWRKNYFARPAQVENQWFMNAMTPGFVAAAESGTYPITTDMTLREAFRWDMRHVPTGPGRPDGTKKRVVLGTTDAWSITKQTKHPDESWELLHFLSGPVFQKRCVVGSEGIIPVLKSLIEPFIGLVRDIRPSLKEVRLEVIDEALDWGYPEDTFWFKNQTCAAELIQPALEKVYTVGDADPTYFKEICPKVDACREE